MYLEGCTCEPLPNPSWCNLTNQMKHAGDFTPFSATISHCQAKPNHPNQKCLHEVFVRSHSPNAFRILSITFQSNQSTIVIPQKTRCWLSHPFEKKNTPPKFHKSPLKNAGTGRRSGFLLGETVTFSGVNFETVKLRGGIEKKRLFLRFLRQVFLRAGPRISERP